jgi:hypothetical protein
MWEIHLSEFLPWERRAQLPDTPGGYSIALRSAENVIYVGLTVQGPGLRGRLRQFHRSATTGQPGHAGGVTYYEKFGPDVSALLVAVHQPYAINNSPIVMRSYVQYAERCILWQYVARFGRLPECNIE